MPKDRRASHLSSPLGIAGGTLAQGMRVGGAGYVLKRMVGRGGISEVWVAWDRKMEKDVALKFLPPSLLQDAHLLELVRSEVERGQKLDHPSIVRIYDFVRDYESVAVAMEYVEGWSLAALKVDRPQKRYRVEELLRWVRPLCEALEYAHHGICIVHRDLKPCNILLNAREHIKITDFGIAHAIRSALAQQGQLVYGAIAYMSPQQVRGAEASLLDDVYSLGATIFDLLTGTPPFYAGEIMAQVFGVQPPSMTERLAQLEIEDSIPEVWDKAVAAALEKDPAQRPQSANEFLQWLESPPKRVQPPPSPVASVAKKVVENPASAEPKPAEPIAREPAVTWRSASEPAEIGAASPESVGAASGENISAAPEPVARGQGAAEPIGQEVSVQEAEAEL